MPTTVTYASDSIFPSGPLIDPAKVSVTYAGVPGLAVWRDAGRPIITTMNEMEEHTSVHNSFGRNMPDPDQKFWNSNDVREGEIRFKTDGAQHGKDLDHDGKDADTFIFRIVDAGDIGTDGMDISFNGVDLHIDAQGNGGVDVFRVRTDADFINFHWNTDADAPHGERAGTINDSGDGFLLMPPCVEVVNANADILG